MPLNSAHTLPKWERTRCYLTFALRWLVSEGGYNTYNFLCRESGESEILLISS